MDMIRGNIDRLIGDHGVNDPAVMEAIMVEYGAPIYRLALSILRDPADAQDATQDTFIQASLALHRYQVGTNFKAWLQKIAINNCRMILRKRATRLAVHQAWEAFTNLVSRQPSIETQVMQDETRDELWDIVDELDEKHRLVVVLRLAHDMTVKEISHALGMNEKTVYTRLYDAFARMRSQIRTRPEFAHLRTEVKL
jgi:RNA polymerase sigma-70 factor (ECF subfamily)